MKVQTMNDTTNYATPATRREGIVMGFRYSNKRLVSAAIAIASLSCGVMAARADTFSQRTATGASQDLSQVLPPQWPSIAPTCTVDCTITLSAGPSSVTVKDTVNGGVSGTVLVPFLGFNVNGTDGGAYSLAGGPTSTIKVPVGTTLTINFAQDNSISDPIELLFPSLKASDVSHVGNTYTVHANAVGTSIFEPGINPTAPRQVAMGLVGTLIVTPADCTAPNLTCSYGSLPAAADEAIVALTDLDAAFAANPSTFDMSYFGQSRDAGGAPREVYHLINGKAFPDTDVIDARPGDGVLLRYVNAGVTDKSMGLLGLRQSLLARNASQYTDPQALIAPLIGPGETADVLVTIPSGAGAGQRYSLMDQGRQMNHGTASGFGGALTFLNVWAGVVASPTVDGLGYDFATQTLTATGHSSAAAFKITGYQTAVTSAATPPPLDTDWSTTVAISPPVATTPISKVVSAAADKFVWVRVQQDTALWSSAVSVQVPQPGSPTVNLAPFDLVNSELSGTAAPWKPAFSVNKVEYSLDNPPTNQTTWITLLTAPAITTFGSAGNVTLTAPGTIWVKVTDINGKQATANVVVAPLAPIVSNVSAVAGGEIAATATPTAGLTVTDAQYFIGTIDPGPAGSTALSVSPAGVGTFALASVGTTLAVGDQLNVRAKDNFGQWGPVTTFLVSAAVVTAP